MSREWGIRQRILLLALGPVLVIALLLALFYTYVRIQDLQQSLIERGMAIARQLAPASEYGVFSGNREILSTLATAALEENGVRAVVIRDDTGSVLTRAGPRMRPHEMPRGPVEGSLVAPSEDARAVVFYTPIVQSQIIIDDLGELGDGRSSDHPPVLGTVAVEMSRLGLVQKKHEVFVSSILITGFLLAITAVLASALARGLTRPLLRLTEAAQDLERGQLDTRVEIASNDELRTLAEGINGMAAALQASRDDLTRQIDDATRELRETLDTVEIQNAELAIAKKEAQQASRAKSEFLASMSHEIRTPLNGVLGYTNLLLRGTLDDGQREYAEIIKHSAESLLTIINDVLDFSRIEANRLELQVVDVELRGCVEEVLELIAPRAHDKRLELVYHIHSDVPAVIRGDPTRLRQILVNLVSNAVKFTDQGSVTVRVQHQAVDSEPGLLFSVADTGVGLTPEQQSRLFHNFAQAHEGGARIEGSGLGLVISRQLAERMQGRLWLESEPGRGTTVRFTLRYEPASAKTRPALPAAAHAPARVLLLEAHPGQRLSLLEMLQELGVEPTAVGDIERLRRQLAAGGPYDAAVISCPAGPLEAEELQLVLDRVPGLGALPLVVLTSDARGGPSTVLAEATKVVVVPKPVRLRRLGEALRALPGSGPARPRPDPDSGHAPAELDGLRILVADDNDINQRLLATLLEELGAQVEAAANGREVLDRITRQAYDLVLMDVHMPEMDGITATALLRSLEHGGQRTPVIAITADVLPESRERFVRAGLDDVLTKPIDEEGLYRMVRKWTAGAPPPPAANDQEVLDDLAALRSTGGREALVTQLRGMLCDDLRRSLPALESAVRTASAEAPDLAHRLRGGAAHCGAPALARAAQRLEEALLRGGPPEGVEPLLEDLRVEAGRFVARCGAQDEPLAGAGAS